MTNHVNKFSRISIYLIGPTIALNFAQSSMSTFDFTLEYRHKEEEEEYQKKFNAGQKASRCPTKLHCRRHLLVF